MAVIYKLIHGSTRSREPKKVSCFLCIEFKKKGDSVPDIYRKTMKTGKESGRAGIYDLFSLRLILCCVWYLLVCYTMNFHNRGNISFWRRFPVLWIYGIQAKNVP